MTNEMIVRAWKDPEYRATLSTEDRAHVPACPSGIPLPELEDNLHTRPEPIDFRAPTCSICYGLDV